MRHPQPLPPPLRRAALTVPLLRAHGIPESRLQRADIVKLGSGVYLARETAQRLDALGLLRLRACGLLRDVAGSWLSHTTAAKLWGLPLHAADDEAVHLSVPSASPNLPRRQGVIGHKSAATADELRTVEGMLMSGPQRLWRECAALLSVPALVILGDSLVRQPRYRFEGRSEPHTTIEGLHEVLHRHPRFPGRPRARAAAAQIRVGADSAQETLLRLAMLRAGLPEPELQLPADPQLPRSPCADLGYRRWRIAIQYDGACHFDADRAKEDRRVDRFFLARGWTVLRYFDADARTGFTGAVEEIGRAIAHRERALTGSSGSS